MNNIKRQFKKIFAGKIFASYTSLDGFHRLSNQKMIDNY